MDTALMSYLPLSELFAAAHQFLFQRVLHNENHLLDRPLLPEKTKNGYRGLT